MPVILRAAFAQHTWGGGIGAAGGGGVWAVAEKRCLRRAGSIALASRELGVVTSVTVPLVDTRRTRLLF